MQQPPSNAAVPIRGTQGYAEQADVLVPRYEALDFLRKHGAVAHLLPAAPGNVLDVGAGTGADAAWFANAGYRVLAVEPTDKFRSCGSELHPSPSIDWLNDSLPLLDGVLHRNDRFDIIMVTAVWMHLDEAEREAAMPRLALLLKSEGVLVLALRHGPVPIGRMMFAVSAEETIALARACGLAVALNARTPSLQPANIEADVTWSRIVFKVATGGQPARGPGAA